jgi:prolyl-tRNA synthetase
LANRSVAINWRDQLGTKQFVKFDELITGVTENLGALEKRLFDAAAAVRSERTRCDITTLEQFKAYFADSGEKSYTNGTGFVIAPFCGDEDAVEPMLKEMGLTIRCAPLAEQTITGNCILTGKLATQMVIFSRAY